MKRIHLASLFAAVAIPAYADVTLYDRPDFAGRSLTTVDAVGNLERKGFANRASSLIVRRTPYEFCDDRGFGGKCVVLTPGRYSSLAAMGLNDAVVSVRPAIAPPAPAPVVAEITLFGREGFEGRSFSTRESVGNFERLEFNDRASSAIVRGGRFEICGNPRFEGRCMVLRPGQYPSLAAMGMNDSISSVRPVSRGAQVEERRFAPPPLVVNDYRPQRDERMYEAEVVSVRAVFGRTEQRCWVERESVASRGDADVGGAIVGGIIGGILGHQVGSGRGNDVATAAGAVAGAAIGANRGNFGTTYTQDVQRCAPAQTSGRPDFYDVRYRFRGIERTVQMTRPPGQSITVNAAGEPRAAA